MAFKIKDGVRVGLTDVFNNEGRLLVNAPQVASASGDTYVSAVTNNSSGTDDNTLRFGTDGTERLTLTTNSLTLASSISTFTLNATTASSNTTTGALVVTGGVGIGGNLNVGGTLAAGTASFASINNTPIGNSTASTGAFTTLSANDRLDVDNIRIDGNTISSTDTNGNIVLDPAGTGYVTITGTNGLVIPSGNTAEQGPAVSGAIRLNSETGQFEGYNNGNWSSLGGVRSVDGLTYITAESAPSASNDTLSFVTNGVERMSLDTDSLDISNTVATVNINATTAATNSTTGALVVDGGVGIGGNLYIGGTLQAASASFSSINGTPIGNATASTGAFTTLSSSSLTVSDATDATSKDTGAVIVQNGGLGVELKIHAGGDITTDSDLTVKGNTINSSTAAAIEMSGADVEVKGDLTVTGNDIKSSTGNTAVSFNDINVTVQGDLTVGGNDIKAADGATALTLTNTSGDVAVAGDLTVTGNDIKSSSATAITLSGADVEVKGDLTVTGNDIKSSGGTIAITLSNDDVNVKGDLDVDANLNVDGTAQIDSDLAVGPNSTTSYFKVLGASGNTDIQGTLDVKGNVTINTNKFQVTAASGNTTVAGTLYVEGAGTFNNTVSMSGYNINNLADPTLPQDAATKAYVDAARAGLDVKPSVKAATTGAITLSGTQTIDGVALSSGDRVLVKNQGGTASNSANGIYVVAAGAWSRADDADNTPGAEVTNGMFVFVEQGTTNGKAGFVLVTNDPITLGTTALEFALFSISGNVIAGNGLSKSGDQLEVNVNSSTGGIEINADYLQLKSTVAGNGLTYTDGVIDVVGTADRISVSANAIDIASTYVGQSSITTLGTIGTGTWQGSVVQPTYGGTGVNNGTKTITLGGNLTTSGAYNTTVTMTGDTTVTMPTTGTLATLSNSETISNKTITNSSIGSSNPSTAAFTTLTANGATTLTANTSSTNTTTGTLVVTGGVGISENLNVGGEIKVNSNIVKTTSGGTTITAETVTQSIVATTSQTALDTFSASTYRSARYLVQITQGTDYQVSEFRVIHNGTTATYTEYSVLETNGPLATFVADVNSGNVRLLTTMNSNTSATINMVRTTVVV